MDKEQHTLSSIPNPANKYRRTKADTWIDAGALLGGVCGLLSLIIGLANHLPILEWLGSGAWIIAVILFWTGVFRKMLWKMNKQYENTEITTAFRIKRVFAGIGLILLAGLAVNSLNSLYQSRSFLLATLCAGVAVWGAILIVQAVKPKNK